MKVIKWSLYAIGISGMGLVEYSLLTQIISDWREFGLFLLFVRIGLAVFVIPFLMGLWGLLAGELRMHYYKSVAIGTALGVVLALIVPQYDMLVFYILLAGLCIGALLGIFEGQRILWKHDNNKE